MVLRDPHHRNSAGIAALSMFVTLVLLVSAAWGQTPAVTPEDTPTTRTIAIQSRDGHQFDVWIDGVRRGPTPIAVPLTTGEHFMTAVAPGLEPILEPLTVAEEGRQTTYLIAVPLSDGRFPQLFKEVVTAIVKHPDNPHVLIAAALITPDRGDFEGILKRIPSEARQDPMLLLAQSKWAFKAGDADTAFRLLAEAIEQEKELAVLWRVRAQFLNLDGQYAEALADADHAVHLEPLNPENFAVRGDAYYMAGKPYAARLDYERALDLDPQHPQATAGLRALSEARP
jgi:hypothetical protein